MSLNYEQLSFFSKNHVTFSNVLYTQYTPPPESLILFSISRVERAKKAILLEMTSTAQARCGLVKRQRRLIYSLERRNEIWTVGEDSRASSLFKSNMNPSCSTAPEGYGVNVLTARLRSGHNVEGHIFRKDFLAFQFLQWPSSWLIIEMSFSSVDKIEYYWKYRQVVVNFIHYTIRVLWNGIFKLSFTFEVYYSPRVIYIMFKNQWKINLECLM